MKYVLLMLVLLAGCAPAELELPPLPPPPPPPVLIEKTITAKAHETYSDAELDNWALLTEGRFRSLPTLKNAYYLYAEDGTHVRVGPKAFATTEEGDKFAAEKWYE